MKQRQARKGQKFIRQVDYIFYNERELRLAVTEARADRDIPKIKQISGFPDPTAREAVRNLTLLPVVVLRNGDIIKAPEYWIKVIDKTYEWCKSLKSYHYEVAKRRYSGEDYRKTCRELHISQGTLSKLLNGIRGYAALKALELGLIETTHGEIVLTIG